MSYFNDEEDVEFVEKITIRVGICAMNKKSHSRPMKEILDRLAKFDMFEIVVFSDE
ncbi:inositol hexakisphosphate and diphosphoinositol-pentakisphosphate kinase 2-like, partial [Paramuricea clavata]